LELKRSLIYIYNFTSNKYVIKSPQSRALIGCRAENQAGSSRAPSLTPSKIENFSSSFLFPRPVLLLPPHRLSSRVDALQTRA
jgi:hypothetical protein